MRRFLSRLRKIVEWGFGLFIYVYFTLCITVLAVAILVYLHVLDVPYYFELRDNANGSYIFQLTDLEEGNCFKYATSKTIDKTSSSQMPNLYLSKRLHEEYKGIGRIMALPVEVIDPLITQTRFLGPALVLFAIGIGLVKIVPFPGPKAVLAKCLGRKGGWPEAYGFIELQVTLDVYAKMCDFLSKEVFSDCEMYLVCPGPPSELIKAWQDPDIRSILKKWDEEGKKVDKKFRRVFIATGKQKKRSETKVLDIVLEDGQRVKQTAMEWYKKNQGNIPYAWQTEYDTPTFHDEWKKLKRDNDFVVFFDNSRNEARACLGFHMVGSGYGPAARRLSNVGFAYQIVMGCANAEAQGQLRIRGALLREKFQSVESSSGGIDEKSASC